ncbi:MAG TPA: right-handed parallel beta-helix repeat-containing protein [Pseudomonadales bacterium]
MRPLHIPRSRWRRIAKSLLLAALLCPTLALALNCATPGKDGAGGSLTGVVNTYYPAAAIGTVTAGSTTLNVGTAAGAGVSILTGDLLLIIQMQYADINSTNTDSYGDGVAGGNASGYTTLQAGAYEYVVATSNLTAGSVNIRGLGTGNGLINNYVRAAASGTQGQRTYQVIRVPQYTTAALSSGLTALPWNGSVGGVLALDIQNNLALAGTVDLSARGFRGGGSIQRGNSGGSTTEYRTTAATNRNSSKGEGISGTPRYVYSNINGWLDNGGTDGYPNGDFAMGAPGNAGGGGVDITSTNHNPGGGGGGNGGVGGRGGYTWNNSATNGSNVGGFGGATVTAAANRVILGGGGGAGSRNDTAGPDGSGGAGGGLVLIRTDTISGAGTITVNGGDGRDSLNEGGGGGGAGGSVQFFAETSASLAGLSLNARGGNGGLAWPAQAGAINAHGPGAGGGGGAILTSTGGATANASGGINGTTTTGALAYGATAGGNGTTGTITAAGIPGIVGGASCRLLIGGTVFDDVNYGGNAGRDYATANASATGSGFASGAIRSAGTRIELYDASGNYLTTQNTNGTGQYSFSQKPGSYQLRVVNDTVNSVRGTGVIPVQTFRSAAPAGTVTAITTEIGGASPADVDAGNNSSSTIAALNAVAGQAVQTLSTVMTTSNDLSTLDFGFNFDTIVNVNDSGQGSLRQFIEHANALPNTNLNQASNGSIDAAAGVESSIFMVPTSLLSSGVASITLASQLPGITGNFTHIDGRTQTTNTTTSTGNTNSGTLGTITTVGTGSTPLSGVAAPEVEIVDGTGIANGIIIDADNVTLRNIAIYGFGNNNNGTADIAFDNPATNAQLREAVVGTSATSFSTPATTSNTGISMTGGSNVTITNSLLGFMDRAALFTNDNATTLNISGSEIRGANQTVLNQGALDINRISNFTATNNLITDNRGAGVEFNIVQGTANIIGNTIQNNGSGGGRTSGLLMRSTNGTSLIQNNVITGNADNGILVATSNPGTLITQNSTYNNGQLGIDLQPNRNPINGSSPYVTQNDNGDGDNGSNDLLNFPVINSASIMGSTLILTGYSQPGVSMEWFIADGGTNPDPNPFSINFGEGQTYLVTTVEGSGADLDNTTGSYSGDSCAAASCTANKFRFSIPLPGGVSLGTLITVTASDGTSTSEFSGVYSVIGRPDLSVVKSVSVESDNYSAAGFAKAIPGAVMVYTITLINSGDGDVDNDSLVITDQIPANVTFVSTPFDGTTNSPVKFTDGAYASGVSVTFDPSDEANDDIDFAIDNVPTWNADSTDTPITYIRIRPQGTMTFDSNPANNPSFTLQFKVTVN